MMNVPKWRLLAFFSNKHAGKTTRNWRWQSAGPSGDVDFDSSHHPKVRKVIYIYIHIYNDHCFNRELLFYLFGDNYVQYINIFIYIYIYTHTYIYI